MSDQTWAPRAPRLLALTGIRFVAAIAVFNAHLPLPNGASVELTAFTLSGHDWMTMFFVLSGLILAWNYGDLLGERLSRRGLRTYFVARLARIYPLYLLALALFVVPTLGSGSAIWSLLTHGVFWQHVFAVQAWSADISVAYGFNAPGWSIGVEFFLYALLPVFLVAVRPFANRLGALIAIAVGAVVVLALVTVAFDLAGLTGVVHAGETIAHRWLYRSPLTRIPDFVLGIALCYLIKHTAALSLARWGRVAQLVGVVLILGFSFVPPLVNSLWSYDVINMVPWSLIMLGLVWSPDTLLARFLGSAPLVFLGECSFAVYLLHQTIIDFVPRIGVGYLSWVLRWITDFALTVFTAAGAHVMFERPVRSWIRRRLDPHPAIAPTPVVAEELTLS